MNKDNLLGSISMNLVFRNWLPLAVTIILISGVGYISLQKILRQQANDPQIALAEEIANHNGELAGIIDPDATIDMSQSLLPFVIVYNEDQKAVAGTGKLDQTLPTPPTGVLDSAKTNGENRLTWQPAPSTREAIVVKHFDGGYVLVGQSLKLTEERINDFGIDVAFGAMATLFFSLLATIIARRSAI